MPALLYDYWRSSSAYRVRIGLNLAEIPFKTKTVNLLEGEQREEQYLSLNPQGFVPTLDLDGRIFTQSLAILEYLHDTKAANLLPDGAMERARVRALAYAISMDLHPICNVSVAKYAVDASDGQITTQAWMQHFIQRGLTAFESMLDTPETGAFCHGDQISLADICLIPQAYNAQRWDVDLEAWPRTAGLYKSLAQIPAVASAHPDQFKS
ncbi:maleylacetoacetate isomerase [Agrobacterium sp. MCAB5]|uniref:maleylacetoacetate isomerase n=1 Tax=Agrobacterium sp. MCAB5 TaxID=3233042 RepID=UPI003F8F814A